MTAIGFTPQSLIYFSTHKIRELLALLPSTGKCDCEWCRDAYRRRGL